MLLWPVAAPEWLWVLRKASLVNRSGVLLGSGYPGALVGWIHIPAVRSALSVV